MGHRVFLLLLLLLLSLALLLIIIGTTNATTNATAGHAQAAAITTQGSMDDGVGSTMRAMVGSRPPSCAGRCWWCGGRRCVAVQVPITPQQDKTTSSHHGRRPRSIGRGGGASSPSPAEQQQVSSYDDHSNYKPLSWRCKCGGGGGLSP